MNDQTAIILHRLETGFRTDAVRLKELGKDFLLTLESARRISLHDTTGRWQTDWNQHWDEVERFLHRISEQLIEIEGHLEHDDKEKLMHSLEAWETIQPDETGLEAALAAVRLQASELGGEAQRDWNTLDKLIRTHLDTLKATAQALRVKMQLLKQYSKEEMDHIVSGVLARMPQNLPPDAIATEDYLRQYRQAAIDIEKEQHQLGGFMDTLKAMFLWVDTPEERLREKGEAAALRR